MSLPYIMSVICTPCGCVPCLCLGCCHVFVFQGFFSPELLMAQIRPLLAPELLQSSAPDTDALEVRHSNQYACQNMGLEQCHRAVTVTYEWQAGNHFALLAYARCGTGQG